MSIGTEKTEVVKHSPVVFNEDIPVDFPLFNQEDLRVYYDIDGKLAVLNDHYTVTLGNDEGFQRFNVRLSEEFAGIINGLANPYDKVIFRREMPLTTDMDPTLARLREEVSHEFDRMVLRLQDLKRGLLRTISIASIDTAAEFDDQLTLPAADARADRLFYFDADGNITVSPQTWTELQEDIENIAANPLTILTQVGDLLYVDENGNLARLALTDVYTEHGMDLYNVLASEGTGVTWRPFYALMKPRVPNTFPAFNTYSAAPPKPVDENTPMFTVCIKPATRDEVKASRGVTLECQIRPADPSHGIDWRFYQYRDLDPVDLTAGQLTVDTDGDGTDDAFTVGFNGWDATAGLPTPVVSSAEWPLFDEFELRFRWLNQTALGFWTENLHTNV